MIGIPDVDRLSLWRYMAEVEGYNEAHTPEDKKKAKGMSEEEADELSQWMDRKD